MMKKKGFTIIELMIVVAILAVLLGIITTVATASIRKARERRRLAGRETLQNGIAAYRERKDEWPGKLEDWAKDPPKGKGTLITLESKDYDEVVQELLKVSAGKSPQNRVLDPVGLLVMRASENNGGPVRDYREAVKKNGKYGKRMSVKEMTVVYPNADSGRGYRYVITYNTLSDSVTVGW